VKFIGVVYNMNAGIHVGNCGKREKEDAYECLKMGMW
jgi:hypothetical protein